MHNKVCLCSDTAKCRWNYYFAISWEWSATSISNMTASIFTSQGSNQQKINTLALSLSELQSSHLALSLLMLVLIFHQEWNCANWKYIFCIEANNTFTKIEFLVTSNYGTYQTRIQNPVKHLMYLFVLDVWLGSENGSGFLYIVNYLPRLYFIFLWILFHIYSMSK